MLATTSSTPAERISVVPTIWGQANVSSVRRAALITPTTSSDRIKMPKTPVPIFGGDQNMIAVVGKTKNNEIPSSNGRLGKTLWMDGIAPSASTSSGY